MFNLADLFKNDSTRSLLARIYIICINVASYTDYNDCGYGLFQTRLLSMAINVNGGAGLAQHGL